MAARGAKAPDGLVLNMRWIAICLATVVVMATVGCGRQKAARTQHDVSQLRLALDLYLGEHGAYPSGTTGEICRLLLGQEVNGQNAKKLSYIEAQPNEINAAGEFLDPWGMPYRIIIQSPPRVYSCGPNKLDENGAGDDIAS
jgi:hypothetical protein